MRSIGSGMAVYLTGDIHGGMDMGGIPAFAEGEGAGLTRDDFLIILGDFGLVWREPPSDCEVELLAWFEAQPWTTLFIDGNHENFDLLEALPVERWHGGRVHSVRPHVIHLMRGETFEICGSTFFCVGGAHSIDEKWRTPHVTWWEQEAPGEEERAYIDEAAEAVVAVDYVLTHCPPTGQYDRYRARWSGFWGPSDEWTDWLEEHVEGAFSYKRWYYGHLHFDSDVDDPHIAVFDEIVKL